MKIALVHDGVVPPRTYGGTERAVYFLARGLHELGHEVTLIARPGSRLGFGTIVQLTEGAAWERWVPADIDIVHLRGPVNPVPTRPYVTTIDGNGKPGETFAPNAIFVSRAHAHHHGSEHFVYNGIDPDFFRADVPKDGSLVFLAKASWSVKNLKGALAVAKKSGRLIHVLGNSTWPLGLEKLRTLGRKHVRFHGMTDDEKKREILGRASALVFPVRWHEPFGIAITEALASGCGVLATPYGSLPEIVTSDVGLLSNSAATLAKRLTAGPDFDPTVCRRRVTDGGRFTYLDMARAYVSYYEKVLATGRLGKTDEPVPTTGAALARRKLLSWTT